MLKTRREVDPRSELSRANLSLMGIPRLYFDAEIEDYVGDDDIRDMVSRYIKHIHDMFDDCVNLTFYGSNGNGKTYLTSIILKNAYRYRYSAQRITIASVISLTFKGDSKTDSEYDLLKRVWDVEFLVLDELGKESMSKRGNEISVIDDLMKYREEKGLPTIICTNLSLEDIKRNYGATLYSMIKQSVCLEMNGEDKRGDIFEQRKAVALLLGEDE
jgi:DNA replication protein DnaC